MRAVLDATGDEDIVIADANGGWRLQDAVVAARLLEGLDRVFFEQPCPTLEECLYVRQRTTLPMVLDEVITDAPAFLRAFHAGGMEAINLKISKLGGLTRARQIRELAETLGIRLTIEDTWGGDLVTAAVSHLAASVLAGGAVHGLVHERLDERARRRLRAALARRRRRRAAGRRPRRRGRSRHARRAALQLRGVSAAGSTGHVAKPEQRVTPLELFFDLVFVFAITQVTGFIAADPTWTRLCEALAILAVLWWAWVSYAWLGNTAASDEGAMRVVLLAAMGPLLVVSLAVPGAFGDDGLIFGVAYLGVRVLHLVGYAVVARGDPALRALVDPAREHDGSGGVAARARGLPRRRAARRCAGSPRWRSTTAASRCAERRGGACSRRTSRSATG